MICSHVYILCSQRGVSFQRIRFIGVYKCEGVGQSSSPVVMGIVVVNAIDIELPDQMSGYSKGWRSAAMSVAILQSVMEGQSGFPRRVSMEC